MYDMVVTVDNTVELKCSPPPQKILDMMDVLITQGNAFTMYMNIKSP